MRRGLLAALLALLPSAHAADGSISKVKLDPRADAIAFSVEGSAPISSDRVTLTVTSGRKVLVVRINGFTSTRTWLKLRDRAIKRVLLHPAKDPPEGALLRIRLRRKLSKQSEEGIRVSSMGGVLLVEVPRNAKVAAAWVAAPLGVPEAEEGALGEVPAEGEVPAPGEAPADEEDGAEPGALDPVDAEDAPPDEGEGEDPPVDGVAGDPEAPVEGEAPPMEEDVPPPPVSSDVVAGMSDLASRVRGGLAASRDVPRVAVLPFDAIDAESRSLDLGAMAADLLSLRLELQPQLLQVERDAVKEVVDGLLEGRESLSPAEARAVGLLLGADTIVLGSVAGTGTTIDVRARLFDATSGDELAAADQAFARDAVLGFRTGALVERSKGAAAWRSGAMPGWGQFYNGDDGRGAGYLTVFLASAAVAVASGVLGVMAEDDYNGAAESVVTERDVANTHYERANIFLAAMGAVWAASVIDAYVDGESSTTLDLSPYGGDR